LFGDGSRAGDAAKHLQMTAHDLLPKGIVDRIIHEPEGGAHADVDAASESIAAALRSTLAELEGQSEPERLEARRARYRNPVR
jgi:acetyl-CoA carboxylase alpha subunit